MTEVELASHFIDWFRDYEIYKEVPMNGGRCDFVVKATPVLIAVEVKNTLNTTVIAQALRHRYSVHYTYIAVPYGCVNEPGRALCAELGIGILGYDPAGRLLPHYTRRGLANDDARARTYIRQVDRPVYRRPKKLPRLHDAMKLSTAGAQHNSMSEFRVTVLEITDHLRSMPEQRVSSKEFFAQKGRFHYGSPQSARQCIQRIASQGQIPEFTYEKGYLILNKTNPAGGINGI